MNFDTKNIKEFFSNPTVIAVIVIGTAVAVDKVFLKSRNAPTLAESFVKTVVSQYQADTIDYGTEEPEEI